MKHNSKAVAYPGLPIIFAEGFRDYAERISSHNSVGCAFSCENNKVRTETAIEASGKKTTLTVNGERVSDARGRGMLRVAELFKKQANYVGGLAITSENHGIPTGSSDSGAAALAFALNDFFELNLPIHTLLNMSRHGSETAFRSLYGGLSEYVVDGVRRPVARQLASEKDLAEIVFYGIDFPAKRRRSDELHLTVVKHPKYGLRRPQVKERADSLRAYLGEGDLAGVLQVMESEARTFHEMVEQLGAPVRTPEMLSLTSKIELWRRSGLPAYWNVAGGSTVYAFTLKQSSRKLLSKLKSGGYKTTEYKIAGSPTLP